MFISDPGSGFLPFRIPDPGSQILDPKTITTSKSLGKNISCRTIFVAIYLNFTKFNIIFLSTVLVQKKLEPIAKEYGFGIRVRKKPTLDLGIKKAPDSKTATLLVITKKIACHIAM
jgi:hypothetical protein